MAVLTPVKRGPGEVHEWLEVDDPVPDPDYVPRGFELIDGALVEKPKMGFESGFTTTKIIRIVGRYLDDHPIAVIASSDATFACVLDRPGQVRKPDAAIILCDPDSFVPPRTNYRKPPEILVEVISPTDTISEHERRVREFLAAGTRLAWVVNPEIRTVTIRRADGTTTIVEESGEVTGEDVLPGFVLPLAKLFPRIPASP